MELLIGTPEEIVKWLFSQPRDKTFTISEYRPKRSRDANAYAWALMNEIANRLRTSKDEVYLKMLKRYGQHEEISVRADIDIKGFFKYYDITGHDIMEKDGQEIRFTRYRIYKGSSEYDSREMSILIDGIVSEAKEMGIETMTPAEIARLKELWHEKKHNN